MPTSPKPVSKFIVRWIKRAIFYALAFIVIYLLIALIGLIPVNNDFVPSGDSGIEIAILSNPVHSDLILPIETDVIDWRDHFPESAFSGRTDWCSHVAIGWGDYGFYVETPTWAEFKITTAANALFLPSNTVVHASMNRLEYYNESDYRIVTISTDQYSRLVDYVLGSFKTVDKEKVLLTGKSYGKTDAFYEAVGTYHCFNTCNCWVGGALKAAGVKVPVFSPLPKSVFLYLPEP